jgi:hypothetical protein
LRQQRVNLVDGPGGQALERAQCDVPDLAGRNEQADLLRATFLSQLGNSFLPPHLSFVLSRLAVSAVLEKRRGKGTDQRERSPNSGSRGPGSRSIHLSIITCGSSTGKSSRQQAAAQLPNELGGSPLEPVEPPRTVILRADGLKDQPFRVRADSAISRPTLQRGCD